MAKAKKTTTPTNARENAIAQYALARAGTAIGKLDTEDLAPGSYPFALDIQLSGELLVENGSGPGETVEIADIATNQVLAGIIASIPEDERKRLVSTGLAQWRDADKAGQDAMVAECESVVLKAAKARKMTKPYTPAGRKGAVKCKPSVRITGSAGAQSVSVEVAGE